MPFKTYKREILRNPTPIEVRAYHDRTFLNLQMSPQYDMASDTEKRYLNDLAKDKVRYYSYSQIKATEEYSKFSFGRQEIKIASIMLIVIVFGEAFRDIQRVYGDFFSVDIPLNQLFDNYMNVSLVSSLADYFRSALTGFINVLRAYSFIGQFWYKVAANPIDFIKEVWKNIFEFLGGSLFGGGLFG